MLFLALSGIAQKTFEDSLAGFDNIHFKEHLNNISDKSEIESRLQVAQRNFIRSKYYPLPAKTFPLSTSSSTCGNFDFEDGNANGWTIAGDYQIMSGVASDPLGNFPVVCPGGNFSLRLNDNNVNAITCSPPGTKSSFSATASNTINLTASNYSIKVNFAGVTLNFPHSAVDAARIGIEFYDQSNNLISSPTYTSAYCNPPGTIVSTSPTTFSSATNQGAQVCNYGQYPVTYYPWQTLTFNLSAYIGQIVKIKLTADWCLYQYDWAYAYFDVCCDSTCPIVKSPVIYSNSTNICVNSTSNTTLCSSTSTNINYNWYGSSGPISTGSCLVTNTQGSYTLQSVSPTNTLVINQEVFNLGLNIPVSFSVSSNTGYSNSSSGIILFVSPPGGVFGGPGISGNTFQPWVVGNGFYSLNYTYTNPIGGCVTNAMQFINVTTCTGIQEKLMQGQFIVAPNPFVNEVLIHCSDLPETSEFILFNTLGQEILRKRLSNGKNLIETGVLPSGLYIYSLLSQNKLVKTGKLVKD